MALTLPDWLTPPNIIGAAERGASIGATLRQQDISRDSAADRLRAAYDQLALKEQYANERAAERQALQSQALEQRFQLGQTGLALRQQALENQQKRNEELAGYQTGLLKAKGDTLEAQRMRDEDLANYRNALIQAKDERGGATVVTHPELPGMKFLRNPSGAETVIEKGDKNFTPAQLLSLSMQAQRMMTPSSFESPKDPAYQARTNFAGDILRELNAQRSAKKSKVDRAHELSSEHPDWTKQQVIDAVNAEQ